MAATTEEGSLTLEDGTKLYTKKWKVRLDRIMASYRHSQYDWSLRLAESPLQNYSSSMASVITVCNAHYSTLPTR